MTKYVWVTIGTFAFGFAALGGNIVVKKSPIELGRVGAGAPSSECDGVAGNLVGNCGFETGDFTSWIQSGDLTYTGVSDISAHSGSFGAFLGPINDLGFLTQTLATTPGQVYRLSFWLRNAQLPNHFQVFWNGNRIFDTTDSADFPYTQSVFSGLVATGSTTELKFGFYNLPDYFYLDDIAVVPTEPCPSDGLEFGSCCGVRYLVNPACETGTLAGPISSDYPPYEELDALPTQSGTCPCDGQPFAFSLSTEVGVNLPVAGGPGTRANVSNVFRMDYRDDDAEAPKPFKCSDFAWTADEAAEKVHNIASWELALFADNYGGHGLNIVKMRPNFVTVNFMFCVVEPQSDEVVACWFQLNGDKPNALPSFVVNKLGQTYAGWTTNRRTKIWNSGKPADWRRTFAPEGMRARFENRTGYNNTNNWDISYRE